MHKYQILLLYTSVKMSEQQNQEVFMSEDGTQTYEASIMLSVKREMEMMPISRQTPEYFAILKQVHKYLHKNCNHNIVMDLIDIDPDRSKTISYCTICGNTL